MNKRPCVVQGSVAYLPLTKGYTAIIDPEDVPLANLRSWYALESKKKGGKVRSVYAASRVGDKIVLLHRVITNAEDGLEVDHENGNGLDNRKKNLRQATRVQNSQNMKIRADNTSGYKGVSPFTRDAKWQACICVNGKTKSLGLFDTREKAAEAYKSAAQTYYGEFARS